MGSLLMLLTALPTAAIALESFDCSKGNCLKGEQLDQTGNCIPCPGGTFMPFSNHGCHSCEPCSEPRYQERVIENCTATNDIEVRCETGWFRNGPDVPLARECVQCRKCLHGEVVFQNCTETTNTVCGLLATTSTSVPKTESTNNSITEDAKNTQEEPIYLYTPVSAFVTNPADTAQSQFPASSNGGTSSSDIISIFFGVGCVIILTVIRAP